MQNTDISSAPAARSASLLSGLLFDDAGHAMRSTHATKNRVRYRYCVSQPHLRGGATSPTGSVSSVSAADIEAVVRKILASHLGDPNAATANDRPIDRGRRGKHHPHRGSQ